MNRRVLVTAISLAVVLVVALVAAGPVQAKSAKAKQKAEHARILRYWTPQRMKNAIPRDFIKTKRGFVPAVKGGSKPNKPGGGGGGGGSSKTVTGASWNTKDHGLYETGKVFFTLGSTNYVCSGSTVNDSRTDYSIVLTAGHCAIDESNGKFASNFMYVPAYDEFAPLNCFSTPDACYTAAALVVRTEFATAGGFNTQAIQHDWAFAVFDSSVTGQLNEDGAFGITFGAPNTGENRQSFGYPAAGKYSGSDLIYCLGPVAPDGNYGTWGMACDMTGGASGGGWVKDYSAKTGALNSVNSYKYTGGPLKNYMFGPEFNLQTEATYNVADSTVGRSDGKLKGVTVG